MNEFEKYNFDLNGFLLVKGLFSKEDAARCLSAVDGLEAGLIEGLAKPASFSGHFNIQYRADRDLGIHYYENHSGGGRQIVVDDFLNASPAFDSLVAHEPTMEYVREFVVGPHRLASSELRVRYKGNKTLTHMGGPINSRNRFEYVGQTILDPGTGVQGVRSFNLLIVRVIYALHDISLENGPLCVVPGSHKANMFSPYGEDPSLEPGMIGIEMEAGDVLFFTENLRHGGFPNLLDSPRRTIHLAIGPNWATSQSPAHWNGDVYVAPSAHQRYSEAQRSILPKAYEGAGLESEHELRRLRKENAEMAAELAQLRAQVERKRGFQLPRWLKG